MRGLRPALFLLLLAALAINAPWITQGIYGLFYQGYVGRLPAFPPPEPGERVLILAPHPDDESLCCGGLIREALQRGAEVHVVWLTSGDGFEWDAALLDRILSPSPPDLRDLALTRMAEARQAASALGLHPSHLHFLCYPDRRPRESARGTG